MKTTNNETYIMQKQAERLAETLSIDTETVEEMISKVADEQYDGSIPELLDDLSLGVVMTQYGKALAISFFDDMAQTWVATMEW